MRLPVTSASANGLNHIYLVTYKEWLRQQTLTRNSQRAYYSRIRQFLLFLEYAKLSNRALEDSDSLNELMDLYLSFLKQSKNEPRSLNANVNALNNFASFFGLQGIQLKRERCYYKQAKILSEVDQKKFVASAQRQESARDRALALALLYTGLRIGDLARLSVKEIAIDTDWKNNNTDISYIRLGNGTRLPLNKSTTLAIKQWLAERAKINCPEAESSLWLTNQGQPLSISGITFVIKRVGWQAGLLVSAEMLRRSRLANATDHLTKGELASQFGGYISATSINRHASFLPTQSAASALMQ